MKLYATVFNETKKGKAITGKEYLDIDLQVGGTLLASLTVRYSDDLEGEGSGWGLYDHDDNLLNWIIDEKGNKQKGECKVHDWDNYGKCTVCGKWNY